VQANSIAHVLFAEQITPSNYIRQEQEQQQHLLHKLLRRLSRSRTARGEREGMGDIVTSKLHLLQGVLIIINFSDWNGLDRPYVLFAKLKKKYSF
jgi:predicted ribosome quality control (RQC) complex YloA/Tae2 family protein